MKKLSLGSFAYNHGVSKQAASKWKAAGHLEMDGKWVCVTASDEKLRAAGLGRFSAGAGPPAAQSTSASELLAAPFDIAADDAEGMLARLQSEIAAGRILTKADAEAIKENALALKQIVLAQKLQGDLIAVESAERVIFESARSMRDAWLSFPSRVGPLIAAELGIAPENLIERLASHVHQQLTDLGEPESFIDELHDAASDGDDNGN